MVVRRQVLSTLILGRFSFISLSVGISLSHRLVFTSFSVVGSCLCYFFFHFDVRVFSYQLVNICCCLFVFLCYVVFCCWFMFMLLFFFYFVVKVYSYQLVNTCCCLCVFLFWIILDMPVTKWSMVSCSWL